MKNKQIKCWVLLFPLILFSCNINNGVKDPGTPEEYRLTIGKLLLRSNNALLEKVSLVDNDIASISHYDYADSLLNVVIQDSKKFDFNQSLAKIYNAGAHIFYGMAYTRNIYLHAKYPIMNFIEVRKNNIENLDSLLSSYLNEKNPLTLIQLKNAWIHSMVDFMKVSQSPIYDYMKKDFNDYLALSDLVRVSYNKEDAYKILMLESEKELFKQVMYLTVDNIKTKGKNSKVALVEFYNDGNKYAAVFDNMPQDSKRILSLTPSEYYQHFYYSEIIVYNLFLKINENI